MNDFKTFIKTLGFIPRNGANSQWVKYYSNHDNYPLIIFIEDDLTNSQIDWGNKIKVKRKTTSNFKSPENYVILECVNRLLEKGYKPENIILEKEWKLGHKSKGFLDIQVLNEDGKSFLMIECKTHGKEYDKAKKETEKDGGQLFSYFIQERNTQYICLYTSFLEDHEIKVFSDIIVVNKEIRSAENSQEAFEAWKPQTWETKGIFGEEDKAYKIEFKGIIKGSKDNDLVALTEKDGGDIYNRFAEILRKNVVSDKTNAFNKIFNLFLCKIVDEFETKNGEKYEFQWQEGESNEKVLMRLNDLYKKGMFRYLDLKIEAVSEEELKEVLEVLDNKEKIEKLFIRQKLYSGNEFAFKEVFDEKTFDENCIVVKEVVKLLEKYRIKYSTKQQFLGDFFELLLNTGIKQESGQFFTPTPIASFICKSIPFKKIIHEKNKREEPYFLPYVIDYASGSGHFLTEAMEEIDYHIKKIDESWILCGDKHKKEFFKNRENFDWASEYIYGIEKDYRLAKTTKISTFLNGDGDANVICGDGLDHFTKSKEYKDKLKEMNSEKENRQFDVLIANPPYSVSGFKTMLKYGKESFELYKYLTDQSSEIECLFIERAKQLLRDGGVAGIILPISILSNGKIHLKAREILLKYFEVKAIVEFGSNTFMATGTKTATIFLRRRANNEWKIIESLINEFFINFKDITVNEIENAFSKYVKHVFEGLELKDYITLFSDEPSKKILNHEIFKEYKRHFNKLKDEKLIKAIKETEKEKLLYFILTYDKDFVLVKSPNDNNEEKEFLGYEFSTRRGHEGIKIYKDAEDKNLTKLYNAEPEQIYDKNKINSYILKAFEGENIPEPTEELKSVLQVRKLHESLDLDRVNFEKRITTEFRKKKVKIESKWNFVRLGDICKVIDSGTDAPQEKKYFENAKYPFIRAGNLNFKDAFNYIIPPKNSFINDLAIEECKLKEFEPETILFAKSGQSSKTNNIAKLKEKAYVVNHLACIYDENKNQLNYVYYYLEKYGTSDLISVDSNYPSISLTDIKNFKIPLPPLDVQEKIVREMEAIETREKEVENEVRGKQEKINEIIENVDSEKVSLGDVMTFEYGIGLPKAKRVKGKYPVVGSNGIDGYHNEYLIEAPCIVIGRKGSVGKVNLIEENCTPIDTTFYAKFDNDKLKYKFVYYLLKSLNFENLGGGMGVPGLNRHHAYSIKIPLPSFSEQEKIVKQIEQIEAKQNKLRNELEDLKIAKGNVLKKYL